MCCEDCVLLCMLHMLGYVHGEFSNFFVLLPQAQNVLKLLCVNWVPNTSPCQSMYLVPTPLPWDRIFELSVLALSPFLQHVHVGRWL